MSSLPYFDYPGFGERARNSMHYSQAVRLPDNTIHISGQGGWESSDTGSPVTIPEDINVEMDNAFENVQLTLEKAGGKGFSQVYKVRVYIVGLQGSDHEAFFGALVGNLEKWFPDHQPLVTVPGVESLGLKGMRIEVEVEAYVGA